MPGGIYRNLLQIFNFMFATIISLLFSANACAETDFTLAGFIKLQAFWDSTQDNKNMSTPIARNNNPNFHHGNLKFISQGSRLIFTIKGPKVFGAQTTGFIEFDFNTPDPLGLANNPSNSFSPGRRHAMFRLTWPASELMFGQYWSMFCEFFPETIQDGPFQGLGMPMARLPQIRFTQKFLGDFTVAALVGNPNNINGLNAAVGGAYSQCDSGTSAESPQAQLKLQYSHDWWGKAAYFGVPIPLTARVIAGWQRNVFRSNIGGVGIALPTFGQDNFGRTDPAFFSHQYLNPWMIMANVFLPVIPTRSANLARTASLSVQGYIGQGLGVFGEGGLQDVMAKWTGTGAAFAPTYDQELYKRYGGYVQAQYYFTNQWFLTGIWGMSKIYGISQERNAQLVTSLNPGGYIWAGLDQPKMWQEVDLILWYRPLTSLKFGLQYSWQSTDWLQVTSQTGSNLAPPGVNTANAGTAHRLQFGAFFFF